MNPAASPAWWTICSTWPAPMPGTSCCKPTISTSTNCSPNAAAPCRALANAHGLTLECLPGSDLQFTGDEQLLRRLVINLLDNAIRYTPSGGKVTAALEAGPTSVQMRVSDTGIGIAPGDAARVFERFYRTGEARSRQDGGFGLGLAIVRWIAESHRGTVECVSQPGRGSSFTVTLPK